MNKEIVPADQIASRIRNFSGEKVLLDFDLAALYGVETRVLNQAVKRRADCCEIGFHVREKAPRYQTRKRA
jgi:hypothetical protein